MMSRVIGAVKDRGSEELYQELIPATPEQDKAEVTAFKLSATVDVDAYVGVNVTETYPGGNLGGVLRLNGC